MSVHIDEKGGNKGDTQCSPGPFCTLKPYDCMAWSYVVALDVDVDHSRQLSQKCLRVVEV